MDIMYSGTESEVYADVELSRGGRIQLAHPFKDLVAIHDKPPLGEHFSNKLVEYHGPDKVVEVMELGARIDELVGTCTMCSGHYQAVRLVSDYVRNKVRFEITLTLWYEYSEDFKPLLRKFDLPVAARHLMNHDLMTLRFAPADATHKVTRTNLTKEATHSIISEKMNDYAFEAIKHVEHLLDLTVALRFAAGKNMTTARTERIMLKILSTIHPLWGKANRIEPQRDFKPEKKFTEATLRNFRKALDQSMMLMNAKQKGFASGVTLFEAYSTCLADHPSKELWSRT